MLNAKEVPTFGKAILPLPKCVDNLQTPQKEELVYLLTIAQLDMSVNPVFHSTTLPYLETNGLMNDVKIFPVAKATMLVYVV